MGIRTKTVQFDVAAAPGGAPAWFLAMADGTWGTIANAANRRLSNVLVSPNSSNPPGNWGHSNGILDGFTGGTIDQITGEYLITAGGGHSDGANNSAYGLYLRDGDPGWRRLTDCTPDSQLGTLAAENDGKFNDGRPRAMHASNGSWIGGTGINSRVLFPMMSSVTSSPGGHADWVLTFNRYLLGAGTTPLAWTGANIGPWTFHGRTGANSNAYGFGGSVFDSVTNQLFAFANASGNPGYQIQRIPVTGATAFQSVSSTPGSPTIIPSWMTIAPDLGIIIIGEASANRVAIYRIATDTWTFPTMSGSGYWSAPAAGCMVGAVYVQANHRIVVADPHQTNGTMYVGEIPTSGGAYNSAGTFAWTTMAPAGGPNTASFSGSGSEFACNKWNLIKDMGNGQSAIVFVASINGPTYIYKVPAAGIVYSYATTFSATENPLSEGGRWVRTDANSTAIRSSGGIAFGTQSGSGGYDDSQAALTGFSPNVRIEAVIARSASIGPLNHEIELCFRIVETATTTKKYEVLVNKDGGVQFMKWLGGHAFDQFLDLGVSASGSFATPTDGMKLIGECQTIAAGQVELRLWYVPVGQSTPIFVASVIDNGSIGGPAYLTGQPGLGTYINDPSSNPAHFGFTSASVADL